LKSITVYHYDVFSKEHNKGNPAGVVLNGGELSVAEMQEIAWKVGFNETAFPIESDVADFRIRFFTPGHEMNLCGHATMAAVYALMDNNIIKDKAELTIETKAGVLPVFIHAPVGGETLITMKQASPQFMSFTGSRADLANSLGLKETDLDPHLPILYGSTGTWTLLLPIKHLDAFHAMNPKSKCFPHIFKEMPNSSLHPFCLETYDVNADMHARHFSSPYSGTIEDAVTGTASGVMGAYYVNYIRNSFEGSINLVVEQGHEIGRDGRVIVQVTKNINNESLNIQITGNAIYNNNSQVPLDGQ
jgi:PhzF family phenazine biosynthesis protein